MPRFSPLAAALALAALTGLAACAPQRTGETFTRNQMGQAASVSFGTVVAMRPVQVQGSSGVGTTAGAVAGGVAGSFIGGDWRSNVLAGIGGAIVGGVAGSAIERGATQGQAVEFVIREDRGSDIAVVQTNEEALQVGERVMVSRGSMTRVTRASPGMADDRGIPQRR
jgi:outer membrane lipoprotein SlyB